jgi:hypothetical protein
MQGLNNGDGGKAIPFIEVTDTGIFSVSTEAMSFLEEQ